MTPSEHALLLALAVCLKALAQRVGLHSDIVDEIDMRLAALDSPVAEEASAN